MSKRIDKRRFRLLWTDLFGGYGSVLDLGSTLSLSLHDLYGDARTPQEVDARALASDWYVVGRDIEESIEKFEQEVVAK
jgi:hypothetical protein